ncbi:MAG: glucokinase [Candidatus Acidiferrales bacterium]
MIVAGDLGGTKSNLGLFEKRGGKLKMVVSERYPSQEHASFEEILQKFVKLTGAKVKAACFAIAGPVTGNKVKATNLPWIVDGGKLARLLKIKHVSLLNDLEGTANSLAILPKSQFETLQKGVNVREANRALIAAGTGLGEALILWNGTRHVPMASEGGHADVAPRTTEEIELLLFLKKKHENVSWEIILSGKGFRAVHEFYDSSVKHAGFEDEKYATAAPAITKGALERTCPVCVKTLDLWVDLYGAEAGNLALKAVARGGVYVAGGIAVKILSKLKDGRFAASMVNKSKFKDFLLNVPIHVLLNENAPLLGAAHVASESH